ncbi:MAG TPA: helix-hairpin-helix domain-containing protein, partial [Candidatus Sulfotelmatobacter sp.]|nr:helix-hairpin-helix domain-containing protein [Candidatus Sulfotelmatobacter sp.]
ISAQGLSEDADRDYISKNINLAQKLSDGAKIYIPKIGEVVSLNQNSESNVLGVQAQTSLININSATSESLDSLPGVGPVTAQKIINSRPYATIDELLSKKIVSNSVFTKIKDKITVF